MNLQKKLNMDIIQRRILASIKTILISSLFILSGVGNAQIVNIGQADNEDRALDITTDMFGNYIILMSDSSSAYVVCADTGMNVLWTRSLEDSDPHNQGQLVELSGGEFLGCMRQDYHSWKSHLFKFNLQGEILWHKTTDLSSVIEDITVFGNEKIAIVGHYAEQQGVTALDKDGNVIWSFRCDPPGFMSYMQNVLTTNDGTLMVVGRHLRVSDQIWMTTLTEVDTSGNVLWDKSFVGTGECTATLQASDNSYYIVSKVRDGNPIHPSSTDIAIVKLSKDGTFMNAKRYGNQYTDMAYDIIEDTEGNLMAFCKSEPA